MKIRDDRRPIFQRFNILSTIASLLARLNFGISNFLIKMNEIVAQKYMNICI